VRGNECRSESESDVHMPNAPVHETYDDSAQRQRDTAYWRSERCGSDLRVPCRAHIVFAALVDHATGSLAGHHRPEPMDAAQHFIALALLSSRHHCVVRGHHHQTFVVATLGNVLMLQSYTNRVCPTLILA
jgi:hypothetical protein